MYNRENVIGKRLENILSQTFQDFEIIIYDNSSDATQSICMEYSKKDDRIKYFHEDKSGLTGTGKSQVYAFNYVLQKAETELFVWASSDDLWKSNFLEKNIEILEENADVVGSVGQVKRYGPKIKEFNVNKKDNLLKKQYNKFRKHFRHFGHISIIDNSYENRARKFLRTLDELSMYAVFRTIPLQKSFVLSWSFLWKKNILNVLKYGKLVVTNETEWFWHTGSSGIDNIVNQYMHTDNYTLKTLLLPYSDYMKWCSKNIGRKFVLRNLDFFIVSTVAHYILLIVNLVKRNY